MKHLLSFLTMVLMHSIISAQSNNSLFNDNENTFLSSYIDPTFTDRGAQYGLTLTKEVDYGYIELSTSIYPDLQPTYYDFIFSGGLSFEKNKFTAHVGPRAGFELRNGGPFLIIGGQLRIIYGITDNIYIGAQTWADYRYSQDAQFYGNGRMLKGNAGFVLAIKLN